MTTKEIKAELEANGVSFKSKATAKELEELLADCKANGVPHKLTAEDLAGNPDLAAQGLKEGDDVRIPWPTAAAAPEAGAANATTEPAPAAEEKPPAPPAEPQGNMEVEILSNVMHDGASYVKGDKLTLSAAAAKALVEAGAAK